MMAVSGLSGLSGSAGSAGSALRGGDGSTRSFLWSKRHDLVSNNKRQRARDLPISVTPRLL